MNLVVDTSVIIAVILNEAHKKSLWRSPKELICWPLLPCIGKSEMHFRRCSNAAA